MIADAAPELQETLSNIAGQLPPGVRRHIDQTAAAIAKDPTQLQQQVQQFLRVYLASHSAIFHKMLGEVVRSIEITNESYRGFTDPMERARELEQYCSRILIGCWFATKNLSKA